MAQSQYKLRFSSLDQSALKASLISYLQNTSEFANFNYNASGIATLVDMLAYNAYYLSLMANFQMNEVFLDTASKRQNVVSRANELGYTPYSKRAAKATLSLTVTNVSGSPSTLVLPAGSSFSTTVNSSGYTFVTLQPYSAVVQYDANNNAYYSFTVDVYEGVPAQNTFTMGADPSLDIPNMDIDTSTLRVFVTLNNAQYEFLPPANFLTSLPTDQVYFLSEGFNSYKISFGNNTFGVQPPLGSPVVMTYLITSGQGANGAGLFSFASTIPGSPAATVSITTINVAAGGSYAEDINSIKTNAVNYFATQDRAVTSNDFKALINKTSTNVKDVIAWGGEQNNPPYFGSVVACVLPRYGDALTATDKTNIQLAVGAKASPNIGIVFVSPTYLNLQVNTTVTYNSNIISQSVSALQAAVASTIYNYISTNLSMFNGLLVYSNLLSAIDRTDASIVGNVTTLSLKMSVTPILQQTSSINFSFNNAIDNYNKAYTVKSSLFFVQGLSEGVWIEDDTNGLLNLMYSKNGVKSYAQYGVGTIDYSTGNVSIPSLFITSVVGFTIDFKSTPLENDIQSLNQSVVIANLQDILVTTAVSK